MKVNTATRYNPVLLIVFFLFAFILAALFTPARAAAPDPTIIVVVDETTYQASAISTTFVTVPRKEVPPTAPGAPIFLSVGADSGSVSATLSLAADAKPGDLIAVAIVPTGETIGEQDIANRGKILTPDDAGKVSTAADVGENTEADRIYTVAAITLRPVE